MTQEDLTAARSAADRAITGLKAQLAGRLVNLMRQRGLNQVAAERLTGINRTEFSRIANGRLALFKIDRLARILAMLGDDVRMAPPCTEPASVNAPGTPPD